MSHIRIRHDTNTDMSSHAYKRGMSDVWISCVSHTWISHITHTHEPCHMLQIWTSHVAHMNECRMDFLRAVTRQVTHTNKPCRTCHVNHMNESCHTYEWVQNGWATRCCSSRYYYTHDIVILHVWTCHFTHIHKFRICIFISSECMGYALFHVRSHIRTSHLTHVNVSYHTYGWVQNGWATRCYTSQCWILSCTPVTHGLPLAALWVLCHVRECDVALY